MPHRAPTFRSLHRDNPAPAPVYDARGSAARRGYDRRWQKFRLAYLSANPMCAGYGKPCNRIATLVDHITPLNKGGAHCDAANSQSLCRACHARKTGEEKRKSP